MVCSAPSSNLFLGSGLFPLKRHLAHRIPLLIGTDIGAGTHFSIWQELADFYKIQMLLGTHLTAAELLYLGTLSAAQALKLDHQTGNFMAGKSADFFILSTTREPYLTDRLKRCQSSEEQLFVLLMMAGPQQIKASYLQGRAVFQRGAEGAE